MRPLLLSLLLALLTPLTAKPPGTRLLLFVGSNTLGERAVPELARDWLEKEKKVATATITRQGELIYISGALPDGSPVYVEVHATGSGDCFKSFLEEYPQADVTCDIGMSSRQIREEEAAAIKEKNGSTMTRRGTEPGEGCEHPIAMDALAIVVHQSNPLHRISFIELRDIYSRKITQWNQLAEWKLSGGAETALAIVPVRRKEPSGTLDFFKERIQPDPAPMKDVRAIAAFTSSSELAASVAAAPGGIGFVGQSYAHDAGLKLLQVYNDSPSVAMKPEEAVFPDLHTIQRELYPLSRFVYLYTPTIVLNQEVPGFLKFAMSDEGQNVIADKGQLIKAEGTSSHVPRITAASADAPAPAATGAKRNVILRLSGSNTVGAECAVNLAYSFFVAKRRAPSVRIDDQTTELETPEGEKALAHELSCDLDGDGIREVIEIRPTGSSDAFRDLYQGLCDVGMSSRPVTEAEKRDLQPVCGNLGLPAAQFALGVDAFAIITAPTNPVQQLTVEQLRRVFRGEITDWSELGGEKRAIQLHARPDRSGTYKRFCDTVLSGKPIAATAHRHAENSGLAEAVAADPGGIGFVPMTTSGKAQVLKIGHEGSSHFYAPSEPTVRSGQYPAVLRRYIYLYVPPAAPKTLAVEARRNWTLAREFAEMSQQWRGQAIVAASGFVTEAVMADTAGQVHRAPGEPMEKFVQRLADLEKAAALPKGRLRPNLVNHEICPQLLFEFNDWSLTPESRNIVDRKLGPWLKMYPDVAKAGLIVEGWADSVGSDDACLKLSLQRAQNVARYITDQLGCPVTAKGGGKSFDPPNTSEENKQQNRRVVIKSAPLPELTAIANGPADVSPKTTAPPRTSPGKRKK